MLFHCSSALLNARWTLQPRARSCDYASCAVKPSTWGAPNIVQTLIEPQQSRRVPPAIKRPSLRRLMQFICAETGPWPSHVPAKNSAI
jgi:hypothetical protein